jgi:hypothetical protein
VIGQGCVRLRQQDRYLPGGSAGAGLYAPDGVFGAPDLFGQLELRQVEGLAARSQPFTKGRRSLHL